MERYVLITRTAKDCKDLQALLEDADIRPRPFPVLRLEEHVDRPGWKRVQRRLSSTKDGRTWLLLTSPRAPNRLVAQARSREADQLLAWPTATVGPSTSRAARDAGLRVDVEGEGSGAGLARVLIERWREPTTAVLAGGVHLRPELPTALEQAGHRILKLKVYAMRATPQRELPNVGPSHAVILTSPRAAQHYLEAVGGLPLPIPHWALGPTTRDAAAGLGIECRIPDEPTMESLAEALKTDLL